MATSLQDQTGIVAGDNFVICLRDDGYLWGIGSNDCGQMGIRDVSYLYDWTRLPLRGVKKIFNGANNTNVSKCIFAVMENGDLYTAGYNTTARSFLGYPSGNNSTFTRVGIDKVNAIACTEYGTAFIKQSGSVYYTGHDQYVGGFSTSGYKTAITQANGKLEGIIDACPCPSSGYMMYLNSNNEFFMTTSNSSICNASPIRDSLYKGLKTDVLKIACGKDGGTAVYQTTGGELYTYGTNSNGQCGTNNTDTQAIWVKINVDDVKQVALGSDHTLVLKSDGTVYGAGYNGYGQLCNGSTTASKVFTKLNIPYPVKAIQCGPNSSYFIIEDNTVKYNVLKYGGV